MKSDTSTLLLVVIVIAALHFGQEILLPFALAFLLSFLLTPFVHRLERWLPRVASVLLVISASVAFFGFFGWIVSSQLFDLAGRLPEYRDNIRKKIQVLQPQKDGPLGKASAALEELQLEMAQQPEAPTTSPVPVIPNPAANPLAIPVKVVETPRTSVAVLGSILGPLLVPIGTAALVLLYTIFMLLQRESLRDRLIRLIGIDRIGTTTQGLDDAASRVSRYLLMQLIVNALYGIPLAVGLYFIGVPNAMLWGLVATVLRFIPFLGPWLAAAMPVALSFAVFDNWNGPMLTIGLYLVLELISNNVLEPWLYGSSTGVSSLAIIIAGVFWTWMWGIPGLMLATPLTVCLAVMGQYVPQLEFLNILLSDQSALTPEAMIYQRLLVLDNEDASETANQYLEKNSLGALYDNVLLQALVMEEQDYSRGTLDDGKNASILQGMREIIEESGDSVPDREPADLGRGDLATFVCLPAKDEADTLAGNMLVELAMKDGVRGISAPVQTLASEMISMVDSQKATTVCVSVVPPLTISHARYLCKRLRQKFPDLNIIVGLWTAKLNSKMTERLTSAGANSVVSKLSEALALIR